MDANELAWAAFRTALISPLLTGEIPSGQRGTYIQKIASEERLLPNGKRAKVAVRTLWRWYQKMRAAGFEGICKQPRSDRGKARASLQARVQRAVELKREQPFRSDRVINQVLRNELGSELPKSTIYRHLRIHGATRKQLGVAKEKVRCRWTRELPNALWQGDFEHGPVVLVNEKACQTRLSAWIDSHSRYIVAARYYLNENLSCLVDSLLRAWSQHGTSVELYADNGKVYHAEALEIACGQLRIRKHHRPPGEPEPGGLIERFFATAQSQFEAEVRASKLLSLSELNRAFAAWLETAYHQQINRETKQSPHERYFTEKKIHRPLAMGSVLPIFHLSEYRTVHQTFEEGLSRLSYLLDNGLVGLVTGASGLGKSALVRRFMQECSPRVCEPLYCHLAQLPANGLLKFVVSQLGEVPRLGKGKLYSQILDRAKRSEGTLLLIFDEAHLLSGEALVDLRLLVSSAVEAGPPLKILLAGQESLKHTLKRAEYTDIVNRVSVRYQLKPLSKDQTRKYIDFQLGSNGGDVKLFDESVKDLIHEFTGGNPRGINNAATACLLGAVARRVARIDEEIFRQASSELQWN